MVHFWIQKVILHLRDFGRFVDFDVFPNERGIFPIIPTPHERSVFSLRDSNPLVQLAPFFSLMRCITKSLHASAPGSVFLSNLVFVAHKSKNLPTPGLGFGSKSSKFRGLFMFDDVKDFASRWSEEEAAGRSKGWPSVMKGLNFREQHTEQQNKNKKKHVRV